VEKWFICWLKAKHSLKALKYYFDDKNQYHLSTYLTSNLYNLPGKQQNEGYIEANSESFLYKG